MIGFDETRANALTLDSDKLAGVVDEPIFGRESKRATLIELRDRLGLSRADTLVTGDGANDLDMISWKQDWASPITPSRRWPQAAPARIEHNDLTALLYVQGYKREEFVT